MQAQMSINISLGFRQKKIDDDFQPTDTRAVW